ncbi:recombinase family protein [Alicyclobacillus mengziensis]|uniref:Recombinase family protein n=1 Tax=Alicyclobacillus mengziensis TaxID=2931921 RepID=A0A9X7W042_9BACL|nr:recombinase family protein [Alicyclobacillus mengziensis]QSO48231.1 recombinase family protein [Alicyclobacillus mengziensis]
MERCAVYARVSTDMQGDSLDNQVDYALEYIRRLGPDYQLEDACVYTDFDESGYYTRFLQRPAIQRALEDAKTRRYDVIVFKEISRISRDQAEHIEIVSRFTQSGVRMIAINDNLDSLRPETLDLLGIHSVMAEMESKRISSRVSSGKKSLARRGYWIGEAPVGYIVNKVTKRLEEDVAFSAIPRLIFQLYTEDGYGTLRIAEYLNARGLLTKNRKLWSRVTVNRVLRNPVYVGDVVYGKTRNRLKRTFDESGYRKSHGREAIARDDWVVVRGAHPPLVDRQTFHKAQTILLGRSQNNPRRSLHPLTGVLICGRCGAGLICQRQARGNREYRYYCCSSKFKYGKNACTQPNIHADEIERMVWQWLFSRLQNCCNDALFDVTRMSVSDAEDEKRLVSTRRALDKARRGLERLLTETEVSEETFERLKINFTNTICALEEQLQAAEQERLQERAPVPAVVSGKMVLNQLTQLNLPHQRSELRRLLHSLIRSITVDGHTVTTVELRYNF